ncbi:dipeptidylpeptidase [Phytophthora boehmeriae]|uniref:Dipeptidylpeptidase n=1 Tax=Phytophthora boehmeriae TaxID=109152 RepID=A0A8T1WY44_9STRA|nr:dipeptidylpeptidase [Phytophthora boehmeriae]
MLFRSNAEDSKSQPSATPESDKRSEDIPPCEVDSTQPESANPPPPIAPVTSKFSALKRKLFPSQNRRHPRRVPPLVSPINAPEEIKTTKGDTDPEHQANNSGSIESRRSNRIPEQCPESSTSEEDTPENDPIAVNDEDDDRALSNINWKPGGGRALIDDDDDRDLESAVEALDFESSIAEMTIEEMNKAIDDLRVWKEAHELKTQQALRELEEESILANGSAQVNNAEVECEDSLETQIELKFQQQQRDREAQTRELRLEAETYQQECSLHRTPLDESDAARVAQALQVQDNEDSGDAQLSRLRDELFQLDVKQRQESLLQELQGAESELDLSFVDVQAFTGELDAILAQFDDGERSEANSLTSMQ